MAVNSENKIEASVLVTDRTSALDPAIQSNWDGNCEFDLGSTSFTFALVEDLPEVVEQLANRLARRLAVDACSLSLIVKAQLVVLREEIKLAIQRAFIESAEWSAQPCRQNGFKLLTLDQQELLDRLPAATDSEQQLSLSPVIAERKNLPLWDFARLFSLSGGTQLGFTPRFGTPISQQLKALAENRELNTTSLTITDDHVVTGSTIKRAAELLERIGVTTQRVLALTQIGSSATMPIDPVVRFLAPGQDPLNRMDLIDFVDFIIGFGGCWVRLAGGKIGQMPYCFPFADPVNRASIPETSAKSFSLEILKANLKFIEGIEQASGAQVLLKDCAPAFARYCSSTFGYSGEYRLAAVIKTCIDTEFSSAAVRTFSPRSDYQQLAELELPAKVIFLDVNNTIFAPGESKLDSLLGGEFKELVKQARRQGIELGLCSDSPLLGLTRLAAELDLDGPILAELGSVVKTKNRDPLVLRSLENIAELKRKIRDFAQAAGATESAERWAVEFGGANQVPQGKWFAFGAGRTSSIAIFGDRDLIKSIEGLTEELLKTAGQTLAIDINPTAGPYGVAIIHPVRSITEAKGEILAAISKLGTDVTMIGDSLSDLAPRRRNLRTILVGNSTVRSEIAERVRFPFLAGVLTGISMTLDNKTIIES